MRPFAMVVMCWVVALCAAATTSADASSAPAKPPRPNVDQLVRNFDHIVFGSEFAGVKASTRIKKWREPLRVVIREYGEKVTLRPNGGQDRELRERRVKRLHFEFVQKHLNTLAQLTGLKTENADESGKSPNFVINFVPRLQMDNPKLVDNPDLLKISTGLLKRLAAHGGCYFLIWTGENAVNMLKSAVIVVNSDRLMNRKDHCVLEEMSQSLGLPNDLKQRSASIFSNYGFGRQLSRADRILIKTLYDPRMRVGTPRAEALLLARQIIAELNAKLP